MMHTSRFCGFLTLVLLVFGCKPKVPENPYSELTYVVNNENPNLEAIPATNFAWLHEKIFRPTCANSGCHDGTFEPEFRSVASAYNTLVNHPVITNNASNSFNYRVVPGDTAFSLLHERLTVFIPNTSGVMPLETSGTDWFENSAMYISKIESWILAGAKDMYGNPAPSAEMSTPPIIYGLAIFPHDNTTDPYPRDTESPFGIGAIEVPNGLVDVWIFPYQEQAYPTGFTSIGLNASLSATNFVPTLTSPFAAQPPITALDFGDSPNQFYYKATLDLSTASSGQTYYLRCNINDGIQPNSTEIPSNTSEPFWYLFFSILVQ
jgi:hypothetical protein